MGGAAFVMIGSYDAYNYKNMLRFWDAMTTNAGNTSLENRTMAIITQNVLQNSHLTTQISVSLIASSIPPPSPSTLMQKLLVSPIGQSGPTDSVNFSTTVKSTTNSTSTTGSPSFPRRLLCHGFVCELGNELFQYASVLGLAFAMNRTAVFMGSKVLDKVLKSPTTHPTSQAELEARCAKADSVEEQSCCQFYDHLTQLDPQKDVKVSTYLQSWKYFEKFKARILELVQFSDSVVQEARNIVSDFKQKNNNFEVIGVHVRKGDFDILQNKKRGYVSASPEFIQRALGYFKERFPNASFVVASNDLVWCKGNFPKEFTLFYLENHSAAVDMAVLSMLDHVVITTGTFSWWAGYLNKGITVYLKDFIMPNTEIGDQFGKNGSDFIYPGWIPI